MGVVMSFGANTRWAVTWTIAKLIRSIAMVASNKESLAFGIYTNIPAFLSGQFILRIWLHACRKKNPTVFDSC
jgi:hypothetical protein